MSLPVNTNGGADSQPQNGEWVVTLTDGYMSKIERLDAETNTRTELSAQEYATVMAGYYAIYYMGVRDYLQAVSSGNMELAQAYHQGVVALLGGTAQT